MDPPGGLSPAAISEISDFYTRIHLPEVVARNEGFLRGTRYELCDQDPQEVAPQWLAFYELANRAAVDAYLARQSAPAAERPIYSPGPRSWVTVVAKWRLIWRPLHAVGGLITDSHHLVLEVIDLPHDATRMEVEDLNRFLTFKHVPQLMTRHNFVRASRYELLQSLIRGSREFPRFHTLYGRAESRDEANAFELDHDCAARFQIEQSKGPPIWQRCSQPWKYRYRKIDGV